MKMVIEINLDNAAFHTPEVEEWQETHSPGAEIARILRGYADLAEYRGGPWDINSTLRDINGNTVGSARIEED